MYTPLAPLTEPSMRTLLGQGFTRFIELGPGAALSGFMRRIDKNIEMLNVQNVATLEATAQALKQIASPERSLRSHDATFVPIGKQTVGHIALRP